MDENKFWNPYNMTNGAIIPLSILSLDINPLPKLVWGWIKQKDNVHSAFSSEYFEDVAERELCIDSDSLAKALVELRDYNLIKLEYPEGKRVKLTLIEPGE